VKDQQGAPGDNGDGEIPRDIALLLLGHSHEYRELIRRRVSVARKQQRKKDASIRVYFQRYHGYPYEDRPDVDELGPEIDGCG